LKNKTIHLLQSVLGYERYLFLFTLLKVKTLGLDRRKSDFIFFNKLLPFDATILVIGACTGITTIPFAQGFKQRNVLAYEPLPDNFRILTKIVGFFKCNNIQLFPFGLSDKDSATQMILPVVNGVKKHGMAHIDADFIQEYREGISFSTELRKADTRPELAEKKINAIKLVAENYELPILLGAKEIILKNRPLIYCELWQNEHRSAVLSFIQSLEYRIYFRQGKLLTEYSGSNYSGKNFIFKSKYE
jgi:FkbM family methyltransferase